MKQPSDISLDIKANNPSELKTSDAEAEHFLGIVSANDIKTPLPKIPIFGIISIFTPILGLFVSFTRAHAHYGEAEGWASLIIFIQTIFYALIVGGVSGIIGLVRTESCIFLSFIGLLVNFLPLILALSLLSH
jgi:hypothetical protein